MNNTKTNSVSIKDYLNQLEGKLDDIFTKKAPQLPDNVKELM